MPVHRKKRRTHLSVETDEVLVITTATVVRAWCPTCSRVTTMVPYDSAAAWPITGTGHRTESATGGLLVCIDSLLEGAKEPPQA